MKCVLKQALNVFKCAFGVDNLQKSDSGQALQDTFNDLTDEIGFKNHVFQTKRDKDCAERREVEKMRENLKQTADNQREMVDLLREINNKLR